MKSINKALIPILDSAFKKSIENFASENKGNFLSDLYVYYNAEDATLHFYDDVDNEIYCTSLSSSGIDLLAHDFQKQLRHTAQYVLQKLDGEKFFKKDFIYMPFTVSLVDKDLIVMKELIFIDDETLKLDSNMWSELNKELDDFFDDLMKK